MLRLVCTFLSAGCADAIIINFIDDAGRVINILVDSGTEETYNLLRSELIKILNQGEDIALWVITHWDNDHIGGIIKFLQDDYFEKPGFINRIWFNANYKWLQNKGTEIGIKQGILLRDKIEYDLKVSVPIINTHTPFLNFKYTKIIILSPEPKIYEEAISKMEAYTSAGRKERDYNFTVEELINNKFYADKKLENRSSIAFLMEYLQYKLIFLADSNPIDIISHLRTLGYSENNPLEVDFMKVAHHGSKRNTSDELLAIIRTNNYIFTADGSERHKLPDKETIARIICHPLRDRKQTVNLFFNHQNSTLESIFDVDGLNIFEKYNFKVHFPEFGHNALIIELP